MRQEKNVNKDKLPAPSRDELRAAQPKRSHETDAHPADGLSAEEAKVAGNPMTTPENTNAVKVTEKDLPDPVTLEKTPEEMATAQAKVEKQTDSLANKYNFAEYDEVKYWQEDSNDKSGIVCWLCKGGTPTTQVEGIDQVDAANVFQDAFNRWKATHP